MSRHVRTYYDTFSTTYEKERHRGYHALVDDLESDLVRRHAAGPRVLEVGCGTGLVLERIAQFADGAVGADLSGGMLAHARRRGLDVVQADACSLPFRDAAFDAVASFKVLAHVPDIERALSEIARVTRPGGRMVLEFYNRNSLRYLAKRLTGPRKVAEGAREDAISTRFDDLASIERVLPPGVRTVSVSGVRVVTPAAFLHRIPLLAWVLGRMEWAARDSWFGRFGGFLVVVVEKDPV